jgi:hypothetical protein
MARRPKDGESRATRQQRAHGSLDRPQTTTGLDDQQRSATGGGTATPTSTTITHREHSAPRGPACPLCGVALALPLCVMPNGHLGHLRCVAALDGQSGGAA